MREAQSSSENLDEASSSTALDPSADTDGEHKESKVLSLLSRCRPSRFLDAFALWLCRILTAGFFGTVFTSYSREESFFRRVFGKWKIQQYAVHGQSKSTGHRIAKVTERVVFASSLKRLRYCLLKAPVGYYEDLILIYTFISFITNYLVLFLSDLSFLTAVSDASDYVIATFRTYVTYPSFWVNSIIFVLFAIFCFPIRSQSLYDVKNGSLFLSTFFERVLGSKSELTEDLQGHGSDDDTRVRKSPLLRLLLLFLGAAAGVLSGFVSPFYILLVPAALLIFSTIIRTPEAGLILSIIFLPVLDFTGRYDNLYAVSETGATFSAILDAIGVPTLLLVGLVLLTLVSYLIKVLRKKRLFRFGLMDTIVLFLIVFVLLYGLYPSTTAAPLTEALLTVALCGLYFLAVNLLRSEIWVNRVMTALQFSVFLTLSSGILIYYIGVPDLGWFPTEHIPGEIGNMSVFFGGEKLLGAYLVLMLPLSLSAVISSRSAWCKVFGAMCLPEIFFVAWSLSSDIVILFCFIEIAFFQLFCTYRTIYTVPLILFGVGTAYRFIPKSPSFSAVLTNVFSNAFFRPIYLWDTYISVGAGISLLGEGFGQIRFYQICGSYADAGFWMRTLFGMGIPGVILYLLLGFFFAQMCLEEIKASKGSHLRPAIAGGFVSVSCVLLYGIFMPVFTDFRITFLFWLSIGIAVSYTRVSAERRSDRSLLRRQPMTARNADVILFDNH